MTVTRPFTLDQAAEMYREDPTLTFAELARQYGCGNVNMRQAILRRGVTVHEPRRNRTTNNPDGTVTIWVEKLDGAVQRQVLIDANDAFVIAQYLWDIDRHGYARRRESTPTGRIYESMHRHLLKPPAELQVDHINGNRLDNRRANLRVVTHKENSENVVQRRGNRRGVSFTGGPNPWRVQIQYNGKRIHIGRYPTEAEAVEAARAARLIFFTHSNEERHK